MICGVCGGVSEYLACDVSIVRIVWGVLAFTGFGLAAYIIAALVMPVQ
jgi:phage shock protein PspC (stress-responsive transcriptional regulator)